MKLLPCTNHEGIEIEGLKLVELTVHGDARGFFVERYSEKWFSEFGLPTHWAQDNHSRSAPGVLRGVHYQYDPPQGKLVGAARGTIWDVAVDIRHDSPTYGKWFGVELSDVNGRLLWVPAGFAHGFCVTGEETADVLYKVTELYNPAGEKGIQWDDPDFAIDWPVKNPTISKRDAKQPSFAEYRENPQF